MVGYDELKALVGCGKSWAEERAQMALQFADQHKAGELTQDEYQELMRDLIRTDKLDAEADDMAVKNALVAAVKGLMKII
jgi:polyhydroxyalkanoate synthesis regulator phasin